jgi:CDP-6-deoxy-D-xylo-4-hexulose-3-dehydrase
MRNSKKGYRTLDRLEITDFVMNNTFWIGVYPGLNEDMIRFMIDTITEFVEG